MSIFHLNYFGNSKQFLFDFQGQMDFLKQNASNNEMRCGKWLILNYAVMCKEIVDKNIRMTKQ